MSSFAFVQQNAENAKDFFHSKIQDVSFSSDLVNLFQKSADFVGEINADLPAEDIGTTYSYAIDGKSAEHGRDGYSSTQGGPGGHGQNGECGHRAGDIRLLLTSIPNSSTYLAVQSQANTSMLRLYDETNISLSARGGTGGNGGDGGEGSIGNRGLDATELHKNGEPGGCGFEGGSGGDGGQGGSGGTIQVFSFPEDADLFYTVRNWDITGGKGGRAGRKGHGGKGGEGGHPIPPQTVYFTDAKGNQCSKIVTSKGVIGKKGNDGVNGRDGKDGEIGPSGTFAFCFIDSNNQTITQYSDRFVLQLHSLASFTSPTGIMEPGQPLLFEQIMIQNIATMPSPSKQVVLSITKSIYHTIPANKQSVSLPQAIHGGTIYELPCLSQEQSLYCYINTFPMLKNIVFRQYDPINLQCSLPRVKHSFLEFDTIQRYVQLAYPVELSLVRGSRVILPHGQALVLFKIRNQSGIAIGCKETILPRKLHVKITFEQAFAEQLRPTFRPFLGKDYQTALTDKEYSLSATSSDPFVYEIEYLAAQEELYLGGVLSVASCNEAMHNSMKLTCAIELGQLYCPEETTTTNDDDENDAVEKKNEFDYKFVPLAQQQMQTIQLYTHSIQLAQERKPFKKNQLLLVTNCYIHHEIIQYYQELANLLQLELNEWNVSLYKGFSFFHEENSFLHYFSPVFSTSTSTSSSTSASAASTEGGGLIIILNNLFPLDDTTNPHYNALAAGSSNQSNTNVNDASSAAAASSSPISQNFLTTNNNPPPETLVCTLDYLRTTEIFDVARFYGIRVYIVHLPYQMNVDAYTNGGNPTMNFIPQRPAVFPTQCLPLRNLLAKANSAPTPATNRADDMTIFNNLKPLYTQIISKAFSYNTPISQYSQLELTAPHELLYYLVQKTTLTRNARSQDVFQHAMKILKKVKTLRPDYSYFTYSVFYPKEEQLVSRYMLFFSRSMCGNVELRRGLDRTYAMIAAHECKPKKPIVQEEEVVSTITTQDNDHAELLKYLYNSQSADLFMLVKLLPFQKKLAMYTACREDNLLYQCLFHNIVSDIVDEQVAFYTQPPAWAKVELFAQRMTILNIFKYYDFASFLGIAAAKSSPATTSTAAAVATEIIEDVAVKVIDIPIATEVIVHGDDEEATTTTQGNNNDVIIVPVMASMAIEEEKVIVPQSPKQEEKKQAEEEVQPIKYDDIVLVDDDEEEDEVEAKQKGKNKKEDEKKESTVKEEAAAEEESYDMTGAKVADENDSDSDEDEAETTHIHPNNHHQEEILDENHATYAFQRNSFKALVGKIRSFAKHINGPWAMMTMNPGRKYQKMIINETTEFIWDKFFVPKEISDDKNKKSSKPAGWKRELMTLRLQYYKESKQKDFYEVIRFYRDPMKLLSNDGERWCNNWYELPTKNTTIMSANEYDLTEYKESQQYHCNYSNISLPILRYQNDLEIVFHLAYLQSTIIEFQEPAPTTLPLPERMQQKFSALHKSKSSPQAFQVKIVAEEIIMK